MDAKDVYSLSYPYVNVIAAVQKDLSDIVEQNFQWQEILHSQPNASSNCSFDAISTGLRFIKDTYNVLFWRSMFVDVMSSGGSAAFYASSFGFKTCKAIEYCNESLLSAQAVLKEARRQGIECNVKLVEGSMQDYFEFDADVLYFDCTFCTIDSMVDEASLLSIFFRLCTKLLAGSFLIIVTYATELTTVDCADLGFNFLECLYTCDLKFEPITNTAAGSKDNTNRELSGEEERCADVESMKLWILKTNKVLDYGRK